MSETALILNKPFERYGIDEPSVEDYLETQETYDDVFYVGVEAGQLPKFVEAPWKEEGTNQRSRLPPGFGEGHYEGSLEEASEGRGFATFQAAELLDQYDAVHLAGATDGDDMSTKYQDLLQIAQADEWDVDCQVTVADGVQYDVFESR